MEEELLVFDENNSCFRKLDKTNYNDDLIVGTIFFSTEAVRVITKYCHICGYVCIDNSTYEMAPIDLHKEEIVMFEGTYNCLRDELKQELIAYNLHSRPDYVWSSFFFKWQFMCDWNVFENNGSFIKLCSNILGSENRIQKFMNQDKSILFPTLYEELCELIQLLHSTFEIDFFNPEYIEEYNYVTDALLNNYHLKMDSFVLEKYCYQVCQVVNLSWEGR